MRRREFIALVCGVATGWPFAAHAQQQTGKLPRIGSIQTEPAENTEAFGQGLSEAGYVDGQNIILDTRYHHGSLERIDEFARDRLFSCECPNQGQIGLALGHAAANVCLTELGEASL